MFKEIKHDKENWKRKTGFMILSEMTYDEVERYLEKKSLIVVPVGSVEQHGLLAPLGCDSILAFEIAKRAVAETETIVAPPVYYGMSQNHLGFTGTISLRSGTLAAIVKDIVLSLYRNGFSKFLFLSGHGGNRGPVLSGIADATLEAFETDIRYLPYWDLPNVKKKQEQLFDKGNGYHGTAAELSMIYYLFPQYSRNLDGIPGFPDEPATGSVLGPEKWKKKYPEGLAGLDPSKVSVEAGENLLNCVIKSLKQIICKFEEDEHS